MDKLKPHVVFLYLVTYFYFPVCADFLSGKQKPSDVDLFLGRIAKYTGLCKFTVT